MVPGFTGSTIHDLPLLCTYDLEIASTKYFSGLTDGVIPLLLLYSGTIFGVEDGRMTVRQMPWSKESAFPLPVSVWRETVDRHFPTAPGSGSAWTRWRVAALQNPQRTAHLGQHTGRAAHRRRTAVKDSFVRSFGHARRRPPPAQD
jgi:hypothetical protein